jgi:hypothetical protein
MTGEYWPGTRRSLSQEEGWATKWGSARIPQWFPEGICGVSMVSQMTSEQFSQAEAVKKGKKK